MRKILARPLTREAFAEFGDVLDTGGANRYPINSGKAERYHDLAKVEAAGPNARVDGRCDPAIELARVDHHEGTSARRARSLNRTNERRVTSVFHSASTLTPPWFVLERELHRPRTRCRDESDCGS